LVLSISDSLPTVRQARLRMHFARNDTRREALILIIFNPKTFFMNSKTTLSISEARKRIFEIAEAVQKPGVYYTLTDKGRPKAVILSYEEYESIMETMDVMEEMPELGKELQESREAVKRGEHKNWTTLEELLAKQGFVLAEKAKKQYGVSTKTRSKGRKTAK